jgi:hypothetical protein
MESKMGASDEGGRKHSCALMRIFRGVNPVFGPNFLRGPLSPLKTRQTRQIRPNLLITLSKLMSGCSKNPTNTRQIRPETRQILLSFLALRRALF